MSCWGCPPTLATDLWDPLILQVMQPTAFERLVFHCGFWPHRSRHGRMFHRCSSMVHTEHDRLSVPCRREGFFDLKFCFLLLFFRLLQAVTVTIQTTPHKSRSDSRNKRVFFVHFDAFCI